jgi:hypothetical protein
MNHTSIRVRRGILSGGIVLAVAAGLFAASCGRNGAEAPASAPPDAELVRRTAVPAADLRGFGRVAADGSLWRTASGEAGMVRFTCQDPAHAVIVAAKYHQDLLAYGAVATAEALPGLGGSPLTVRHGGTWLIGVQGSEVLVASADTREALAVAAARWGAATWQAVTPNGYPRYLDQFDNASFAMWWMPTVKTPEQLEWMRQSTAVVNLHNQALDMTPAPGVVVSSGTDLILAQVRQMGKPYRHMLWNDTGLPSWLNWSLLPGEHYEIPAVGYTGRGLFEAGQYQVTQLCSPMVNAVLQSSMVELMQRRVRDPNLLAWMEPHGEFFLTDPATRPPGAAASYPAYLSKVLGYDLDTLATAYGLPSGSIRSWQDVPLPDTAWFAGRRGQSIDLDDQEWRVQHAGLDEGTAAGYATPTYDDASWSLRRRDSMRVLGANALRSVNPAWFRFTHDVPAGFIAQAAARRIRLHVMPYSERDGRAVSVWVNGRQVAKAAFEPRDHINRLVSIDVTDAIVAGSNTFAIHHQGGRIAYRVFLSTSSDNIYPFADTGLNRRYIDWKSYLIHEKLQNLESYLRVMRSVDPVRPIKVMTPHLFQADALDLCERYGAYAHLTGESPGFYRPMHYKGYSRLRGLPATSEPGGASSTTEEVQGMFGNIFWESQDNHDYVFDLARDTWSKPQVKDWYAANRPLLSTLGKIDFAQARLGVLRDVRQDELYGPGASEIWNWDLSRGALPALGLTPVLVDGQDLERGRADGVPVILDNATKIMEPAMVDAVERYVRQGGTFIAQHHTGVHAADQMNTWQLAQRFGLEIMPRVEQGGAGAPSNRIAFTTGQSLWPSLRGATREGRGFAMDWKGNEYRGSVAIRGAGPGITPIATWEDGSMAVAEVRLGKGRMIWLGSPFLLGIKDQNGRWFNQSDLQQLIVEMLASVGVVRETQVSDERVWFERRESKNGLYQTYLAVANGVKGKDWKAVDVIRSDLGIRVAAAAPLIEPSAAGAPDVTASFANGLLTLRDQTIAPFQVRQFAMLRPEAKLAAPLHWLAVQQKAWRAIEQVPASVADKITADAKAIADGLHEDGLDLNAGWKVSTVASTATDWMTAMPQGPEWTDGAMGSWLARGMTGVTTARYRKQVELPASWRTGGASRVLIGLSGFWQHGLRGSGSVWVDGREIVRDRGGFFICEVSNEASDGVLDLAIQVTGRGPDSGPGGTLYLRRMPKTTETQDLAQGWVRLTDYLHEGDPVTLPLDSTQSVFGLKTKIQVPAAWAGRPVRLVIDSDRIAGGDSITGLMINDRSYFRGDGSLWFPIGVRIDRWLQPGANEIVLLGQQHIENAYTGFKPSIRAIRLEVE